MFGKIKGRLKDVFKSAEEHVEDNADSFEKVDISEISEAREEELGVDSSSEEKVKESKKKSFFGKIFGKKDEEELNEVSEIEDEMLSEVSESEKEAIKEHKDLSSDEVSENLDSLEEQIEKEEVLESETMEDVRKSPSFEEVDAEVEKIFEEEVEKKEGELDSGELEDEKSFVGVSEKDDDEESVDVGEDDSEIEEIEKDVSNSKDESLGFFSKTFAKIKTKEITENDFDKIWVNLQLFLLEINIAYEIVEKIEDKLRLELIGNSFSRFKISDKVRGVLESEVYEVLKVHEASFLEKLNSFSSDEPIKVLVLGVNGTGKTTTIAKIVKFLQENGKSVCVAAADTFRAAAVEQLEEHSKNLNFKLIMHKGGSDPAAVAFDAIEHAKAKNLDVVLIDTAGRMPNNSNLMMELEKVKRVSKSDMAIFVGDSVAGNDLIEQIELFDNGVEIDGAILTKVDTDERPGSVVTTAYLIDKPIYFLGVGQGYDDLIEFDSKLIAEKLFDLESSEDED